MRAASVLCLAWLAGCHRQPPPAPPPSLAVAIEAADPASARQLVRGLHDVEGTWRWTAGTFAFRLGLPPNAAQQGAALVVEIAVPDPVINANHDATVACSLNGVPAPPQIFTTSGRAAYRRVFGPIAGSDALVECAVSKLFSPGHGERRELGLIWHSARLEQFPALPDGGHVP